MAAESAGAGSIASPGMFVLSKSLHCSNTHPADQKQAKFDLGISLILFNWDALTAAVQNGWGGPDGEDKRAWFAGAISELFTANPSTDAEDVEDMLVQVMGDEFEVGLEDGSEIPVAVAIVKIKQEISEGNF